MCYRMDCSIAALLAGDGAGSLSFNFPTSSLLELCDVAIYRSSNLTPIQIQEQICPYKSFRSRLKLLINFNLLALDPDLICFLLWNRLDCRATRARNDDVGSFGR